MTETLNQVQFIPEIQFYLMGVAFNKEASFADIYMNTAPFQVHSILDYDHKMCSDETDRKLLVSSSCRSKYFLVCRGHYLQISRQN